VKIISLLCNIRYTLHRPYVRRALNLMKVNFILSAWLDNNVHTNADQRSKHFHKLSVVCNSILYITNLHSACKYLHYFHTRQPLFFIRLVSLVALIPVLRQRTSGLQRMEVQTGTAVRLVA
jgi:hypothetical protein